MSHRIEFSPEALADLNDLYDYIAARSGDANAIGFIDRIETFCQSMTSFPTRGTIRDDLSPGLRVVGFERNSVIAITVTEKVVTILRVFNGGRDVDGLMK